ncbi:hypothetical protein [uncultured Sphingomonas sp.]|uniref:hypothetical protein n=1 Tax=uncultured Sphingomonas sp. TaxID=158754 RepID=UPI0025ECFDE8|nr:hypothetical protein [uncultured Sphingomonas sp.]
MQERVERIYYERRALDALARAKQAADSSIANIHLQLFQHYLDRADGKPWPDGEAEK